MYTVQLKKQSELPYKPFACEIAVDKETAQLKAKRMLKRFYKKECGDLKGWTSFYRVVEPRIDKFISRVSCSINDEAAIYFHKHDEE